MLYQKTLTLVTQDAVFHIKINRFGIHF